VPWRANRFVWRTTTQVLPHVAQKIEGFPGKGRTFFVSGNEGSPTAVCVQDARTADGGCCPPVELPRCTGICSLVQDGIPFHHGVPQQEEPRLAIACYLEPGRNRLNARADIVPFVPATWLTSAVVMTDSESGSCIPACRGAEAGRVGLAAGSLAPVPRGHGPGSGQAEGESGKTFQIHRVIAETGRPVTNSEIQGKVKGVRGKKAIPKRLQGLPRALRATIRTNTAPVFVPGPVWKTNSRSQHRLTSRPA
jgi:hypothetical protein